MQRTGEQLMSVVEPATLGAADFVRCCDGKIEGAVGTLQDAPVMLFGPMGTAFHLHDEYQGFASQPFTPRHSPTPRRSSSKAHRAQL
jgi:hypothetical protein